MTDHPASHASPPLLLLMKGHPASGKSRLARLIAASFKMALSDKDDSRDCFHAAEEQFGSAAAWDLNALSYQVMFRVASTQLACGNSVVIDCPLSKLELYQQAKSLADKVLFLMWGWVNTLLTAWVLSMAANVSHIFCLSRLQPPCLSCVAFHVR